MLARSEASGDLVLRNIVQSTAAIVFLGTPHRGSQQMAGIGETVRKIASVVLKMDTSPAALNALGLKTTDLERCQESFSQLWRDYDFTVKTFQEGLGLTGVNIGPLSDKVVPDYSSALGDARERAETLQANHMSMCRFTGREDPNYHKVSGELRGIYLAIERESHGNPPPVAPPAAAGQSAPAVQNGQCSLFAL
jgi:protein SERAC1